VLVAAIVVSLIYVASLPKDSLKLLLIDLELNPSTNRRHTTLTRVIQETIPERATGMAGVLIEVEQLHFTEFTRDHVSRIDPDFILLSPQSTPWRIYDLKFKKEINQALELVRELGEKGVPILGICGGHQFLAMAFGGSVDFIDEGLIGLVRRRYTSRMDCERGWKRIYIKRKDPIFEGLNNDSNRFWAFQWHCEEVKSLAGPLVNLAESDQSRIQILRLPGRLVYGMAFHPESGWARKPLGPGLEPNARRVLSNYLKFVRNN
jgi:GMP synthase (glutamine-hydrolysing)